jgi:hypothetical protein
MECCICFEELTNNNLCVLSCNHKFHLSCWCRWNKPTCPYCRQICEFFPKRQIVYEIYDHHINPDIFFIILICSVIGTCILHGLILLA